MTEAILQQTAKDKFNEVLPQICEEFGKNIGRHIAVYGADNEQRLTGQHETQAIDAFSFGVSATPLRLHACLMHWRQSSCSWLPI